MHHAKIVFKKQIFSSHANIVLRYVTFKSDTQMVKEI